MGILKFSENMHDLLLFKNETKSYKSLLKECIVQSNPTLSIFVSYGPTL